MNDVTQPTSMIGAGMPEDVDEQQLMSLLPSSPMPMAPPPPEVSPGLAAGSGMLSALQGQAYNPYLVGQQKSADSAAVQQQGAMRSVGYLQQNQLVAQAQQMRMLEMQRKAEEAKKTEKLKAREAQFKIADAMLKHPDETVRRQGGREFVRLSEETGIKMDPAIAEGLSRQKIDRQNLQDAARYLEFMPPENVQALTGVPINVLQNLADPANQQSDAYSVLVHGKDRASLEKEKIDLLLAKKNLKSGQYPEDKTPLGIEASVLAQTMFDTTLESLPQKDRANVLGLAKKEIERKDKEKRSQELQDKITLEREKAALDAARDAAKRQLGDKDLTAAQKTVVDNISSSEAIIESVEKDIKDLRSIASPFERYTTGPLHRYYDINMQSNTAAAAAQSRIEGSLAKLIRAMGEVGTLTDQDIARARKLWPVLTVTTELRGPFGGIIPVLTLPDTDAVTAKKLLELKTLLHEIKARTGLPKGAIPFAGDAHMAITGKPDPLAPKGPLNPTGPAPAGAQPAPPAAPTAPVSGKLSKSQIKALQGAGYTPEQIEAYKKAKGMQ